MKQANGAERMIGELSGAMKGIANDVVVIREDMRALREAFTALEAGRVTALESKLSYLYGVMAFAGVVLPILISFLMNKFFR